MRACWARRGFGFGRRLGFGCLDLVQRQKHEMIVMAPYHITVPIRIQDDVFKLLASFLIGGPLQPLC